MGGSDAYCLLGSVHTVSQLVELLGQAWLGLLMITVCGCTFCHTFMHYFDFACTITRPLCGMCKPQSEPGLVASYEAVVSGGRSARDTAVICMIEMFAALNEQCVGFLDR